MDRWDPLKAAAVPLDALLRDATHQTLLHGDAKLANFCWRGQTPREDGSACGRGGESGSGSGIGIGCGSESESGDLPPVVAAVDFQYAGWGVGVLDIAYCLGSFPGVDDLACDGPHLLDAYFAALAAPPEVEAERRALHCVAVADFERFLAGWAGSSFRRGGFVGVKVQEALALIA